MFNKRKCLSHTSEIKTKEEKSHTL